MGLIDMNSELGELKGLSISLKHTPKQRIYLIRDLTSVDNETLWKDLVDLRRNTIIGFKEIGRRLKELQTGWYFATQWN